MDDLFKALAMFQQGAQQYATGNAIRSAADQVQQLNMNEEDEFKKRQQLNQLGQGLALQLGAIGAPVSQIQSAAGAIIPQQMQAPQDFFAASQQATSPKAKQQLAQAGQGVQSQLAAAPLTKQQQEQLKLGYLQLFGQQQQGQAQIDLQKELKTKEELEKVDESQYRYNQLINNSQKLRSLVEEKGTVDVFGSGGAEMDKLLYEMAIDYAKLVDPASVAREGEVEAAKKYMLPLREYGGLGYSNSTAVKLIDQYATGLQDRLRSQQGAKAGVRAGLVQTAPKDAMILETQNRLQQKISRDPNDPSIPAMQRALENARRGKSNK